jgi:hypothetical protein
VTSLANMVDAAVKNSPDGTGSGWNDFAPALDTDGEPMLIADGTLAGTYRMMTGESAGGFEVRFGSSPASGRGSDPGTPTGSRSRSARTVRRRR